MCPMTWVNTSFEEWRHLEQGWIHLSNETWINVIFPFILLVCHGLLLLFYSMENLDLLNCEYYFSKFSFHGITMDFDIVFHLRHKLNVCTVHISVPWNDGWHLFFLGRFWAMIIQRLHFFALTAPFAYMQNMEATTAYEYQGFHTPKNIIYTYVFILESLFSMIVIALVALDVWNRVTFSISHLVVFGS